jgi:hypothetical protein
MKLTNKFQIPLSLAVWLAHDEYDRISNPKTISATSLLKPTKSVVLSLRSTEQAEVDISELVSSSLGTSIHSAIEAAWKSKGLKTTLEALGLPTKVRDNLILNPRPEELTEASIPVYMEMRSTKPIGDWFITGKFDYICDGRLEDFKSTGTYNYISQSNKDKYIQQASIYRWLNPTIITDDTFVINYIFTDWSSTKAKQEKGYPQGRLLPQKYTLMSLEETELFIKNKLTLITNYLNSTQDELPKCTDEELWAKPAVFKYYKNPQNKTRSTKNFDTYWEAHNMYSQDGSVGEVVEVKGEVVFCKYCNAKNACNQAKQYIQEGRLLI